MNENLKQNCCEEFEKASGISRRTVMAGAAAAGALVTFLDNEDVFGQAAFADTTAPTTNGNVVIVLSQRGGCDGLSLLVPYADPNYYKVRPNIGVPQASLLGIDSMFGLHPGLKPLYSLWQGKSMAALTATGLPQPNRSHFEAMDAVEDAAPGTTVRSGWINRTLGLNPAEQPSDGIQVGSVNLPESMSGPANVLSLQSNSSIGMPGWVAQNNNWRPNYMSALNTLWSSSTVMAATPARAALGVQQKLLPIVAQYVPANGATYSNTPLSNALQQAAQLVKANIGTRVITLDHGSWDFHSNLGTLDRGLLAPAVNDFATSVAAFVQDLGPDWMKKVTIVTLTEFGRRVQENGDLGLDHGWGNTMWVIGAGVNGGKVYGKWPTLAPTALTNGDLSVTTDYRDLLAEIVSNRLGTSLTTVFPGYKPNSLGIVSSR